MYVCVPHVYSACRGQKREMISQGWDIRMAFELQWGCWESIQGPLEEQPVCFTVEVSLSLSPLSFLSHLHSPYRWVTEVNVSQMGFSLEGTKQDPRRQLVASTPSFCQLLAWTRRCVGNGPGCSTETSQDPALIHQPALLCQEISAGEAHGCLAFWICQVRAKL